VRPVFKPKRVITICGGCRRAAGQKRTSSEQKKKSNGSGDERSSGKILQERYAVEECCCAGATMAMAQESALHAASVARSERVTMLQGLVI